MNQSINTEVVVEILTALGTVGARNDEIWEIWREGRTLTEDEIFAFQAQVTGRTSELAKLGVITFKSEQYQHPNGKVTYRSRYFIPAKPLGVRASKSEALKAALDEAKTALKEMTARWECASASVDRLLAENAALRAAIQSPKND